MNAKPKIHYRMVDYPARLRADQVGQILGFEHHDIPVLIAKKLLTPLGNPVPNAQKFFAAVVILELAHDITWLQKATKALYSHWQERNSKKSKINSHPLQVNSAEPETSLAA